MLMFMIYYAKINITLKVACLYLVVTDIVKSIFNAPHNFTCKLN